MKQIHFTKMHGLGNDFVVLDNLQNPLPDDFDFAQAATQMCDRHFGIGGDGLLLLCAPDDNAKTRGADVRMRMWNPDGSEDMCGNGLRCVARLAHLRGYVGDQFVTQTLAGLRQCEIIDSENIRVAMGKPRLIPQQIPFAGDVVPVEYSLQLEDIILPHVSTLSTGSVHTIIFVEEFPDDETFLRLSPQIEHHAWFPERTSVMWAKVLDDQNIQIRIWERGVQEANGTTGETLACGTGACATAVAAAATRRCGDKVKVHSRGGVLEIAWREGEEITMMGAAIEVFEGVFNEPEA